METPPKSCAQVLRDLGFRFEPRMGGNCTAYSRPEQAADPDSYVLVTIEGGGLAPETIDESVLVGWYTTEQELPVRHEVGVLRDLIDRGLLAP